MDDPHSILPSTGTRAYLEWRAKRDGLPVDVVIKFWNEAYQAGFRAGNEAQYEDEGNE